MKNQQAPNSTTRTEFLKLFSVSLLTGLFSVAPNEVQAKSDNPELADTIPSKKTKTADSKVTIDANNALIVTSGQTGGLNTVNVNQIPLPKVTFKHFIENNLVVKEIQQNPNNKKLITLPTEKYKYDSLYKTKFTLTYECIVALAKVGFIINREDVVHTFVDFSGSQLKSQYGKNTGNQKPTYIFIQPESGEYTFTFYTTNKFENPVKDITVIK